MADGTVALVAPNPGTQRHAQMALVDYSNLAAQLRNVLAILADLQERETNHDYMTQYNNTATYAVNPDGSPGAEDPAPVATHPMVGQAISATEVQGFVGYIVNDLANFLTGVAGPTVADRRPAIFGLLP